MPAKRVSFSAENSGTGLYLLCFYSRTGLYFSGPYSGTGHIVVKKIQTSYERALEASKSMIHELIEYKF